MIKTFNNLRDNKKDIEMFDCDHFLKLHVTHDSYSTAVFIQLVLSLSIPYMNIVQISERVEDQSAVFMREPGSVTCVWSKYLINFLEAVLV